MWSDSSPSAEEVAIRNIPNFQLGRLTIVREALRPGDLSLSSVRTSEVSFKTSDTYPKPMSPVVNCMSGILWEHNSNQ